MLDEMQAQWLARVAEGCAHARVGLTLRGAFGGGLLTGMLVQGCAGSGAANARAVTQAGASVTCAGSCCHSSISTRSRDDGS
jgi:hypothetical protein